MTLKRFQNLFFLSFIAVAISGCALSHDVDLPTNRKVTSNSINGAGRIIVVRVPFSDQRIERQNCGKMNDLLTIKCSEDPALWIAKDLVRELSGRNFSVETKLPGTKKADLTIIGALEKLELSPASNATLSKSVAANIRVKLTMRNKKDSTKTKSFTANGKSSHIIYRYGTKYYNEAITGALNEMMIKLVSEVDHQTSK